jgi:hypothetical protein
MNYDEFKQQTAVWDVEHRKIVEDVLKRLEAEPRFTHFRDEVIAEFLAAEPRPGGILAQMTHLWEVYRRVAAKHGMTTLTVDPKGH